MLGIKLHALRGPFYSPKGPRSRWSSICRLWLPYVCGCTRLSGAHLSHRYLGAPKPRREIITKCARNKSYTYDDSWYRNEYQNINI
jgi:hypothetical protein